MKFNDEVRAKYSSGSLLKKVSCKGREVKVDVLDVKTACNINRRVHAVTKQIILSRQQSLLLAETEYSD